MHCQKAPIYNRLENIFKKKRIQDWKSKKKTKHKKNTFVRHVWMTESNNLNQSKQMI